MANLKFSKLASHESRTTLIPSYLDEDPDIDLILPDPDETDPAAQMEITKAKPTRDTPIRRRQTVSH